MQASNCMLLFLIVLIFNSVELKAQYEENPTKYDLYIETGFSYKISDYLPGFSLNAIVYSPEKKVSFGSSNVFLLKIEKIAIDSNQFSSNYQLSQFRTLNYLDVNYNFNQKKKHPFCVGVGIGWIYDGEKENFKFNSDYGYGVCSFSFKYKVTWFYVDFRGDLPFDLYKDDQYVGTSKLFPFTLGLTYRFQPKKSG